MHKLLTKPVLALASLALFALTACSEGGGGATTHTDVDRTGLAVAEKNIADHLATPTSLGLTEPLKKLPTGKTIYELEFPGPIGQVTGDAVVEACASLGCKVVRVPMGTDAATTQAAWDRAVTDKPDAVVAAGVTSSQVGSQMRKLRAEGVPVVVFASDVKAGDEADVTFGGTARFAKDGALQADWIVADSKGAANIVAIDFPDLSQAKPWEVALKGEASKTCPTCHIATLAYGFAIAKEFPSRLVSYLQQHPDVHYIAMVYGDQYVGVEQALSAAGLADKVTIVGRAGTSLNFQSIVDGGPQKADIGNPAVVFAWGLVDSAARLMAGQDAPAPYQDLTQVLTAKTITFDPATNPTWVGVTDFKEQFKKSWGVD